MSTSLPTPSVYTSGTKVLHWLTAVLIAVQFAIGWTMPDVTRKTLPIGAVGWHVTVGVLIVVAVAARVVWRIARPPRFTDADRGWPHRIARATHLCLYALLVVVPILGWANASSRGWSVGLTDGFALPSIMTKGAPLGHVLGDIHGTLATVMAVVIGLHVVAALYRQWFLRDGTLRRMV